MLSSLEKISHKKYLTVSILLILLVMGFILRFTNLNWGNPYFFHPDERNIASAVSRIQFPKKLNPEFFAYGSFPVYLNALVGQVISSFKKWDPFSSAIMIGRIISAFSSILLIGVSFLVGKRMFSPIVGLLTALLVTFNTGLVQYARFSTFESLLALEYLLILYLSYQTIKYGLLRNWMLLGLVLGLAVGTKVTSLLVLGIYPYIVISNIMKKRGLKNIRVLLISSIISFGVALIIFLTTNPFSILDSSQFISTVQMESGIARGDIPVFWTRQFVNTTPVIFHFTSVFPWILGSGLTIFLPFALLYGLWKWVNGNQKYGVIIIVLFPHLIFNFIIFTKWIRYMIPLVPILLLLISTLLVHFIKVSNRYYNYLQTSIVSLLIFSTVIWSLAFASIFIAPDTRKEAALWAELNFKTAPRILSETHDLGILPFNKKFQNRISLFHFYDLDSSNNNRLLKSLSDNLQRSDYFVVLSRRVWKNAFLNPERFPKAYNFYSAMFNGDLGFQKVYESSIYPSLFGFEFSDLNAEETFRVFDHPTVMIFEKQYTFDSDYYLSIIKPSL